MRFQGRNQGRGRFNHRGGRGRGGRINNNNNQRKYSSNKPKDRDIKFYSHSKGQQQTYTYETVLEHILSYIQRSFESSHDVVESLRSGTAKTYTMPTLQNRIRLHQL